MKFDSYRFKHLTQ